MVPAAARDLLRDEDALREPAVGELQPGHDVATA